MDWRALVGRRIRVPEERNILVLENRSPDVISSDRPDIQEICDDLGCNVKDLDSGFGARMIDPKKGLAAVVLNRVPVEQLQPREGAKWVLITKCPDMELSTVEERSKNKRAVVVKRVDGAGGGQPTLKEIYTDLGYKGKDIDKSVGLVPYDEKNGTWLFALKPDAPDSKDRRGDKWMVEGELRHYGFGHTGHSR